MIRPGLFEAGYELRMKWDVLKQTPM